MKRITNLQRQIFEAHLDAFVNDSFTHEHFYPEGADYQTAKQRSDLNIANLKQLLLDGKTVKSVWTYLWEKHASITSQLIASPDIMYTITGKAKADVRTGFRDFLNRADINIS